MFHQSGSPKNTRTHLTPSEWVLWTRPRNSPWRAHAIVEVTGRGLDGSIHVLRGHDPRTSPRRPLGTLGDRLLCDDP